MEFIDLKAQYAAYKNEIDGALMQNLQSARFIMGGDVGALESELCAYSGARHAVCCSSGTDALILALMALDIKSGDEVITSPFSFIASVEAIMLLGAKPVFVDICEQTYNINPQFLERAITKNTKAIVPVSIFGQMADLEVINAIASAHNIPVIEDAAQSFGASFKSVKSCNASIMAATSFFPSKPLGCYGDGGAVFCNDDNLAQKLRYLANHGQTARYKHDFVGLNSRLDTLQAGILRVKLRHFDDEINVRQNLAKIYNENLKNVITPAIKEGYKSVYAQYSIRTKEREKLMQKLSDSRIPYAVHYPIPLHLQAVVRERATITESFAISEKICEEIISLPFSAFLGARDQESVIKAVNG